MPSELRWEDRAVTIRYWGRPTSGEIAENVARVEEDVRFTDLRSILHDFRACSGLELNPERLEELAAMDWAASLSHPRLCVAVVTTHSEVEAAVAAYLCALPKDGGFPVAMFADIDEALLWIDSHASRSATVLPKARTLR